MCVGQTQTQSGEEAFPLSNELCLRALAFALFEFVTYICLARTRSSISNLSLGLLAKRAKSRL